MNELLLAYVIIIGTGLLIQPLVYLGIFWIIKKVAKKMSGNGELVKRLRSRMNKHLTPDKDCCKAAAVIVRLQEQNDEFLLIGDAYRQAIREYTESPYEFQGNALAEKWILKRVEKLLKEQLNDRNPDGRRKPDPSSEEEKEKAIKGGGEVPGVG